MRKSQRDEKHLFGIFDFEAVTPPRHQDPVFVKIHVHLATLIWDLSRPSLSFEGTGRQAVTNCA
jgi:hypothetical protein